MKLNKKLYRQHADPGKTLDANNGLLYARQVEYIVRTDVKQIDGAPVLILHFFPRERTARGDYRPVWTMFQGRDGYITLERGGDGKTRWRTSAFEKLFKNNYSGQGCAFYASEDERRVAGYFHDDNSAGFSALIKAQDACMAARRKERQLARERKVLARMEGIPPLPDDLEAWAHRTVLPAYFFYDRATKRAATGVCSCCGKEVALTDVKHNGKGVCPSCGREVTMKARGRAGRLYDRETCQVIQRTGSGELLIRIIKARMIYQDDTPCINVYENARQFIRLNENGDIISDRYYLGHGGEMTNWKAGDRPTNMGFVTFDGETCGHLYCKNLPEELKDTPWQYCPIDRFYGHFKEPLTVDPFLAAYLEHPRLEHLIKTGFYNIAADMVYHYYKTDSFLDENQDRTHRILNVGAEDVAFLRDMDPDLAGLKVYQEYCRENLKDRQQLMKWQLAHHVKNHIDPIRARMTVHKMIRYLDGQYGLLRPRKTPHGAARYESMQALVTEYADYLDMCAKQDYDMKNSFILYPKDVQKAHDRVARRIKAKADAKLRRDFDAAYRPVVGRLDFQRDGLRIVYPASPDDIVAEGQVLHHCVGGYVDRVAREECLILFLRRCDDETKPFYTIEVKGREVAQVRGRSNEAPTPEVRKFMAAWKENVLQRGQELERAA